MDLEIPGIGKKGTSPQYPKTSHAARPDQASAARRPPIDEGAAQRAEQKRADYETFLNQILQAVPLYDRELKFVVNRQLDEVVVKVIDTRTDKVIKEIPPKEIQQLEARIREAVGLLIDKKA